MAIILKVFIVDGGDNTIKVGHEFYGLTEKEAQTYYDEHLGSCSYFHSARKDDRLIEIVEEVDEDELPTPEDWEDYEVESEEEVE